MNMEQLQLELTQALKEKNKVKRSAIGEIVTRANMIAIEKGQKDNVSEDMIIAAIAKEEKMCKDMIDNCPVDRADLLEKYEEKLNYILALAPQKLTEAEVTEIVAETITELEGLINMGTLMKASLAKMKGRADNKMVSKVVADFVK